MGLLFGMQRRASGGIQAPMLTHLTWAMLMLRFLPPLFERSIRREQIKGIGRDADVSTAPTILWFRRDLRLHDHPALDAAAKDGPVTALFVLDDVLLRADAGPRTAFLYRTLRALDEDLRSHGGGLTVKRGRPENVVPAPGQGDRRRARSTSARTSPPTAAPATSGSRPRWAVGDAAPRAHRQPVCRVAGPRGQEGRRPRSRSSPPSTARGPSAAGTARRRPDPAQHRLAPRRRDRPPARPEDLRRPPGRR